MTLFFDDSQETKTVTACVGMHTYEAENLPLRPHTVPAPLNSLDRQSGCTASDDESSGRWEALLTGAPAQTGKAAFFLREMPLPD